jgi:hypothetical protein
MIASDLSGLCLRLTCACATLAALAAPAGAQPVRLLTPNATLAEEFSAIRGVRELSDGRLLVSDYIDQRVVLVDLDRGTVTARIGKGGGPQEARLPTRLVPMPGDSTILVDLGNNRLLILDGQGRAARSMPTERPGVQGVRGVDAAGAFYFAVPAWMEERPLANDSVRIVKWHPRSDKLETIAVVQGDRMRSDIRSPALTPRIPTVGYAAQDAWVMGEGSVLRIVRAAGYRVETRAPGAAPVIGPSHAYATRPVSAADRLAYVRRFMASSPTSGKGENGGMGYSPTLSDAEVAAMARGTQYAEQHPMFSAGEVIAAPGGRLWVGRPAGPGRPVLYDVFDDGGRRVTTVELGPGRWVAAVGRQQVYVVIESDLGIQHLERYPLPR